MKADNLFRFVAIRPPTTGKRIIKFEGHDASAEEIIKQIKEWFVETGVLGKAFLVTGRDVIHSENYYTAMAPGRALVAATEKIQSLLQTGANNPDFHDFQDAGLALLAPINPRHLTLDKLLDSKEYQMVKWSFWRSYYASVLNPYERPQDREEIVSWLLLFHLLESGSEAEFQARIEHLSHTRPAVPYAFFAQTAESQHLPQPPVPPMAGPTRPEVRRLKELEARIGSLQNARRTLQDLFVAKLHTIEQARPSKKQPLVVAERPEEQPHVQVADEQSLAIASTRAGFMYPPPWRVTGEDLDSHAQTFQLVRSLGLLPETITLPDLINRVDSEIATLSAEASRLKTRVEIMLVGKTFVKIRQPLFYADDTEDLQ